MKWQFLYIEVWRVNRFIGHPDLIDYDEFIVEADNIENACAKFNEFIKDKDLWGVDSSVKNLETWEEICIDGLIDYKF